VKLRRLRSHFSRRSGQREFLRAFISAFGLLWLVIEPLGLFFPNQLHAGWRGYGVLAASSVAWGAYRSRPRNVISRRLPPTDVAISIRIGDLLAQTENVVVGSNDVFDTSLDHGIISPKSVQGQLLERVFDGDRAELDRQISDSLAGVQSEMDVPKTFGNTDRYDIGTVARVRNGGTRYFLTAFARMSSDLPPRVQSTIELLQISLARLWPAVDAAGQREAVHVPVLGSHLARLKVSHTLLIQLIVLSFIASETRSSSLTVWVHEADSAVVDMAELDEWLAGLCAV
jgi:hypothetical protein